MNQDYKYCPYCGYKSVPKNIPTETHCNIVPIELLDSTNYTLIEIFKVLKSNRSFEDATYLESFIEGLTNKK